MNKWSEDGYSNKAAEMSLRGNMNCTLRALKAEPGQDTWQHSENQIQRALFCSHLLLICKCPCSKFKHLVADYSLGVCFPPNWKPVCFYSLPFTPLVLVAQLCPTLCDPVDCSPPGSSVPWDVPGKNTEVGFHSLLQGISPDPGIESGSPALQAHSLPPERTTREAFTLPPEPRGKPLHQGDHLLHHN